MHFPDEPYVRVFTRKTVNSRRLGWEGRAVLRLMIDEFDRAGIFETEGEPAECIALVTEMPIEIVRIGLERLLKTHTWTLTDHALVWPTYVEAQTCAKSDRVRQQESRSRRALNATRGGEASRHDDAPEPDAPEPEPESASHAVTTVTNGHAPSHESQTVTLSLADPSLAEPLSRTRAGRSKKERRWKSFPKRWRGWSIETSAEAVARGLTQTDLAAHVDYWSRRRFPGGTVDDLDGELRDALPGIAERKAAKSGNAPPAPAPDPYAWAPTDEHRGFCKRRALDLAFAVQAYRAAGTPKRATSTLAANEDFMRRLKWWAEHGEFLAAGKLPQRQAAVSA